MAYNLHHMHYVHLYALRYTICCADPCCSLQTRFEVVVVHDDQEKCRDAIYASAAGAIVPKAVHITGQNFSKGKNNTITSSNFRQRG